MVIYRIYKYINGSWVKTSYAGRDKKLMMRIFNTLSKTNVLFDIKQEIID